VVSLPHDREEADQDRYVLSPDLRISGESYNIPQVYGAARFLLPVSQCEFQLTQILEGLKRDPWPVANDKRPLRCTGVAMSVAVGLLEATYVRVSISFPSVRILAVTHSTVL
jgi:protein transport protein SEC23